MAKIGTVLGYDLNTLSGVISSEGARYPFKIEDWKVGSPPRTGMLVDFVDEKGQAREIFMAAQGLQRGGYAQPGAKSKIVAGILGILLGGFGIHRFYLGYIGIGIAQIAVTIITCGVGALWGFIEGILILVGSINVDAQGNPLTDQ